MFSPRIFLTGFVTIAIVMLTAFDASAQYKGLPVKKDRLVKVLRTKQLPTREIIAVIKKNGVDFKVTPAVEQELVGAGARSEVVAAATANYRVPATAAKRATTVKVDTTDDDYERLYDQAYDTLSQMPTATSLDQAARLSRSVIELSNQAIKLDATRPDAYKLICTTHIFTRNFVDAERNCQLAVDRGGSLAFPVYHLYPSPHRETLYVGKNSLSIESPQKLYQFTGREVSNLRSENDYALGTARVAVFSMQTFQDGDQLVWLYTPGNTGTTPEANMIMQLINRNSIGGR